MSYLHTFPYMANGRTVTQSTAHEHAKLSNNQCFRGEVLKLDSFTKWIKSEAFELINHEFIDLH